MTAFPLLILFIVLALCAFFAFGLLTFKQNTPRLDDWKKFLSSFAGTALALSVGFISLMLQQENQLQEKKAEELTLSQRKLSEENEKIRSTLLYSIIQKKFEFGVVKEFGQENIIENVETICDSTKDQHARDTEFQFQRRRSFEPEELQLTREAIDKLFSNQIHDRNALVRLMRETGFSSRISQDMLSHFLDAELEWNVLAPKQASQMFNLYSVEDAKIFCSRLKLLEKRKYMFDRLIKDVMKLQLSTCAAYSIIGLPIKEGFILSPQIFSLIKSLPTWGLAEGEKSSKIQKFWGDMASNIGEAKSDWQVCLTFADVDLEKMP